MDTPLTIELVAIDLLKFDDKNPRKISQFDFEALQRSIDEFGFVQAVVVNKRNNVIIAGHQRARAAREIGLIEVPVTWVDVDEPRQHALNIALNKIGGEFDNDMLAELLQEMDDDLITLTGFDEDWPDLLQPAPLDFEPEEKEAKDKEVRFTTEQLRTLAKSLYPNHLPIIMDFLRIVDERSDKH